MISFKILLFCFGDQHLIFGDLFVPDGHQKASKEKIELGTLLIALFFFSVCRFLTSCHCTAPSTHMRARKSSLPFTDMLTLVPRLWRAALCTVGLTTTLSCLARPP